mmetsp:Transcript_20414/g.28630  ORF Transcript_20414/g.28630 Transcript_20414/m.28630 type:complete len:110 (+) Transcript_20414:126-455(+)|eukprot:CAMPEP_0168551424 /NCGR_PEP_ID=MMETSP0413-20121227/6165_1 /TAXON_ID=136452 /ORGANISM="Filamoeba nolandi, Strain NC-AS-23-1" /LENGTH=109 /DNA_ID=CAMNT_0008581949 /DNA_START=107 /DNA_END=436 /DNA_ORIENTATION=+
MRIIAAYLLAILGGNSHPGETDLRNILNSVGIDSNQSEIREFLEKVKDKDPAELISLGASQLSSFGSPVRSEAPRQEVSSNTNNVVQKEPERKAPESDPEDFDGINLFD